MFDKLCSPEGITADEVTAIYGYVSGCRGTVQPLAGKHRYEPDRETEGNKTRFFFRQGPFKSDKAA